MWLHDDDRQIMYIKRVVVAVGIMTMGFGVIMFLIQ